MCEAVEHLRLFFMQESNEDGSIEALDVCFDFIRKQSVRNLQQSN